MKKFESEKVIINTSSENIYNFLADFNNFQKLMPEQIVNWKSTENNCSFTISGMADISMRIQEKIPFSKIIIVPDGKVPFTFELICDMNEIDKNSTQSQLIFMADLNPMLSMMASKPLQNFVNILAQKLKEYFEKL